MKELEAGPELDALVAEKVFGCTPKIKDYLKRRYAMCGCKKVKDAWPHGHFGDGCCDDGVAYQKIPDYSTDIAAAWEVVEKMLPILGHIYPSVDAESGKFEHWVAVAETGDSTRFGAVAETAPLAICRAALRAVTSSSAEL